MTTRFGRWTVQLASPPAGRGASVLRLLAREKHVLIPSRTAFEPPTDLYETQGEVVVRIEIAGLKSLQTKTTVEVQDELITISGERDDPAAGSGRHYERMEIETGRFERTIRVPVPVDASRAVATYDDGFLVIRLPKCEPVRSEPRSVKIE